MPPPRAKGRLETGALKPETPEILIRVSQTLGHMMENPEKGLARFAGQRPLPYQPCHRPGTGFMKAFKG